MARTALTVNELDTTDGWVESLSAANVDGHSIARQSKPVDLIVANGSGGSITVTILVPNADSATGLSYTAPTYTVAASAKRHIPIRFGGAFAQATTGATHVDFSAVTSVTVGAVVHT